PPPGPPTPPLHAALPILLAEPRDRVGCSASAVGTAPLWLLGALVYLIAEAIAHHGELFQISLPTTAVLIGFGAQLLIGVMSHLRSEEHTSELQSRFDLVC